MTPALLLALALSSSGPAHAADAVNITPKAVNNLQVGLSGGTLDLVLEADRPRGLPIRLRALNYELFVGNVLVTSAAQEYDGVVLRKGEPATFTIPVRLDASTALSAGMKALSSGSLDLRLRGEAKVRVLIFPLRIDFDERLDTKGR